MGNVVKNTLKFVFKLLHFYDSYASMKTVDKTKIKIHIKNRMLASQKVISSHKLHGNYLKLR